MDVKRISYRDTYEIRNRVLRPAHFTDDYKFPGDQDEQSFHLGAFVDKQLASVASFFFECSPHLEFEYQFRLRGMATLPEFQKQGLSKALLQTAFPIVGQNMCQALWCNARESAIGFYLSVGFLPQGEIFDLPHIGKHQFMYRVVNAT